MGFLRSKNNIKFFIIILLGYWLFSCLGDYLTLYERLSAPIWFASGYAFFCLRVIGIRAAIPIFVASVLKYWFSNLGLGLGFIVSLGVVGEALFARTIFLNLIKKRTVFLHYSRMVAVFVSAVMAPLIGATFGVLGYLQFQPGLIEQDIGAWVAWYSGNMVGCLLFFPLLMSVRRHFRSYSLPAINLKKIAAFFLAVGLLWFMLFNFEQVGLLLLVLPILTYVLSYCGTTPALFFANLTGVFCAWSIKLGYGPFSTGAAVVNSVAATIFTVVVAICALVLVSFARAKSLRTNLRFLFLIWIIACGITLGSELISWLDDIEYFHHKTFEVRDTLQQRMRDYERALQGAAAFYRASDQVTFDDWKVFAEEFDLPRMLPGAMGIGFIQSLKKEPDPILIKKLEKDGVSVKKIVPILGLPDLKFATDRFVVKFFEPQNNAREIVGVDIGADPVRRRIAEDGRDRGIPVLLTRINLLQDAANRVGFVLLVPVYRAHADGDTALQRSRSHIGWIYAPFIVEEFMVATLKPLLKELDISIAYRDNNQLLFSSNEADPTLKSKKNKFRLSADLALANSEFILYAKPGAQFDFSHTQIASAAAFISVTLGLLLAIVLVNLQLTNRRVSRQVNLRTQELYRAQRLAEAHRIKSIEAARLASLGEMAGGIAHEINNPLSVILAKAFNLKARLKKGNIKDSEILGYIEKIEETSFRIAKIVKGMRTLSYDGSQHDFEVISLNKIIDDTLDIGREKFKSKGIEVRLNLKNDFEVRCRPIQISQVLINLLNNAEYAIESMRDPWIQITTFSDEHGVAVEVMDSGTGITEEVAKRMMEPFYTTKEVGKGTGLGLSIARSIMKENMGTLEYNSHRAHTTFIIHLQKAES